MIGKVKLITNLEFLDLSWSPGSASDHLYDFRPPDLSEPPFLTREVDFLARAAVRDEPEP